MQQCAKRAAYEAKRKRLFQPTMSEKHEHQVSHSGVGPRGGRVSKKVSSKSSDQVAVNNRAGVGPATTLQQSTAQQCWSDHPQTTSL